MILHKHEDSDIKNCSSCGYNECEIMATAINNNLNKAENCHLFIQKENRNLRKDLEKKLEDVHQSQNRLSTQKKEIIEQAEHFLEVIQKLKEYTK